jgi:Protein of unknown function (DUF1579)
MERDHYLRCEPDGRIGFRFPLIRRWRVRLGPEALGFAGQGSIERTGFEVRMLALLRSACIMKCPDLIAIVAVAAFTYSAGSVRAQEPKPSKDAQSSYEPRSAPGAGQKYLEAFVGEWDVVKTFSPRSGGAPTRTPGTCRQTMIHDGRFLQSEFIFEQAGRKTSGLGLTGFDPQTGRFTTVWTDSRQTRMSFRQSRESFDGKQIILFSRSLDDGATPKGQGQGPPPSRTVSRIEDNGRKIVHRQFNAGPDGKDRLIMELVMTRRPTSPSSGR